MLSQVLLSTGIQWVLFMILPVISYVVYFRKEFSFPAFLGLKEKEVVSQKYLKRLLLVTGVVMLTYWGVNLYALQKYGAGDSDVRLLSYLSTGWPLQTIAIILVQSILQTSFLEEIIFRGFMINALREKTSFIFANNVQAFIFTVLHVLGMIQMNFGMADMIITTIVIYAMSLLFGKLAKASNYSVPYSVYFHAMSNLAAAFVIIYVH